MTAILTDQINVAETRWFRELPFEAGTIDLLVKMPTFGHRLNDWGQYVQTQNSKSSAAEYSEAVRLRIEQSIVGWEGLLNKDGEPIPFTFPMLEALLGRYHDLFMRVRSLMTELYDRSYSEDSLGKFVGRFNASSTAQK